MKRLVILGVAVLLSVLLSLSTANGSTSQAVYSRYPTYKAVDYSYTHWRKINRNTLPPACTLPLREQGVIKCEETGKAPDESEFIEWSSYSIWLDCFEKNNRDACEDLTN